MRNNLLSLIGSVVVALMLTATPARAAGTDPAYNLTLSVKYPAIYQPEAFTDNFMLEGSFRLENPIPGVTFYTSSLYNTQKTTSPWYYDFVNVGGQVNLGGGLSLFVEGERRFRVNDNAVFAGLRFTASDRF